MATKIWQWINDRIPVSKMLQLGLDEEIPGGSSFFFTLGSATLFIFIVQIVTGIWQLFYYVPTVDHAYDSLNYMRLFVPYGWLIHGLHYWGASAMVVLVGLHMLRVFIWGAYKKPREITWLVGVLLLLITVGMSFTGAVLPWDERGYWAAVVGTSLAGTIPFIGSGLKFFIIGGNVLGQVALSRFFILHTAIIPGIAMIMIAAHIIAFRKFGSVGPWTEEKRKKSGAFWPDQVSKDIIVAAVLLLLLVLLSAFNPPPFTGPADPLDASITPKPEWNFLFLYQALKFFPGSLEVIGTVGIPTLVILILVALPFIDRKSDRNPLKRPAFMIGGSIFVALILTLTIFGYKSNEKGTAVNVKIVSKKSFKLSPSAEAGKQIFATYGCIGCHTMSGQGGTVGPVLTNEPERGRTNDWIMAQLKDPKSHNPKSIMPAFTALNDTQLTELTDFLLSEHPAASNNPVNPTDTSEHSNPDNNSVSTKGENTQIQTSADTNKTATEHETKSITPGPAAEMIGNVSHGALLFQQDCESCHGTDGQGGVPNPGSVNGKVPSLNPIRKDLYNSDPQTFANNIDVIIQHGSVPTGQNPALHMFDYGDSHTLTQQQIAHLEAYILNLNGVNRAQIEVSAFTPKQYFLITAGIFIGTSLILIIIGVAEKNRKK